MVQAIDLTELYSKAFGISIPEYKLNAQPYEYAFDSNGDANGKFGSPKRALNPITGGYYFMPVYLDIDNSGDIGLNDYELPYPIVRVQSQKRIIETALTERKGTVVEIINQESWKIYIKGFIISKNNEYPEDEIYKLKQVYEKNEAFSIRSVITDLFLTDGDKVVVKSLNFPEVKGVELVKPYELELISVNIFDLITVPV